MKNLFLSLLLLAYSSLIHAQETRGYPFASTYDAPQTASILRTYAVENLYEAAYRRQASEEKCHKYHKMKVSGIVLTSIGGAFVISGAVLVGVGVHSVAYDPNGISYNNNAGFIIGGAALLALGIVPLGVGIPLTIVGAVKGKKYCNGDSNRDYSKERERSYLELKSDNAGLGLALRF